jgi:hypothetical protein
MGGNVITPKKNVRNQKYMPFKKIKTTYSCLLEIDWDENIYFTIKYLGKWKLKVSHKIYVHTFNGVHMVHIFAVLQRKSY